MNLFELPQFQELRNKFDLLPVLSDKELLKKYKCLNWYNYLTYHDPNNIGKNYYKFTLSLDRQKLITKQIDSHKWVYIGYELYRQELSPKELTDILESEIEYFKELKQNKEPYCIFKANSLEEAIQLFNKKILK